MSPQIKNCKNCRPLWRHSPGPWPGPWSRAWAGAWAGAWPGSMARKHGPGAWPGSMAGEHGPEAWPKLMTSLPERCLFWWLVVFVWRLLPAFTWSAGGRGGHAVAPPGRPRSTNLQKPPQKTDAVEQDGSKQKRKNNNSKHKSMKKHNILKVKSEIKCFAHCLIFRTEIS